MSYASNVINVKHLDGIVIHASDRRVSSIRHLIPLVFGSPIQLRFYLLNRRVSLVHSPSLSRPLAIAVAVASMPNGGQDALKKEAKKKKRKTHQQAATLQ